MSSLYGALARDHGGMCRDLLKNRYAGEEVAALRPRDCTPITRP